MHSPFYCQKSVTTQRPDANARVLKYANQNRDKRYFNDITVTTGQRAFSANRVILSCYSKYFEEKFEKNEKFHQFISIDDITGEIIKLVIDFIYSGKITIDQDNVIELLKAAHKLQISELREFCFDFLGSVINPNNCLYILDVASLYHNLSLKSTVHAYMRKNIVTIINIKEFQKHSKQDFIDFLSILSQITPESMKYQYNAIILWTKYKKLERQAELSSLFQLLTLSQLPKNFLMNIVAKENLIKNNLDCSTLLEEHLFVFVEGKQLKYNKSSILSIGGRKTGSNVTEVYSFSGCTPKQFPNLPMKLIKACSLKMGNSLVCLGGDITGGIVGSDKVWQMNLLEDHLYWKEIASLNERRCYVGATLNQQSLVVAGGNDGNKYLTSTELYTKESNRWKLIAPLNQGRRNHALVASENCLFALGGFDGQNALSSVEKLFGYDEPWKYVQSMTFPRSLLAAVAYKNKVFAIGGLSTNKPSAALKSVEVFDQSNWKWTEVKSMNTERWGHSACILQDKIIVVGGMNKEGKFVKEIECYDLSKNMWWVVGVVADEWGWHSIVSL